MGKTLHLHVGLPKCGSSSLQAYLIRLRPKLLDQGYDYLDISDSSTGNLTPSVKSLSPGGGDIVFRHFNSGRSTENASDELFAAIDASPAPNLILSAESVAKRRRTHDFREITDRFETVQVHLALRPRVEWVVSHYAQGIKTGKYRGPLETFLQSPRFQDHVVPMLTFADHFSYWQDRVGPEYLHLHFAGSRFPSMVDQFLSAIGLQSKQEMEPAGRRNQSPSAFVLSALATVRRQNRAQFLKVQKKIIRLAERLDPSPEASLLTWDVERFIRPKFEDDSQAFLAIQDRISAEDLWPDYSERQEMATRFDDVVQGKPYQKLSKRLATKGIDLPREPDPTGPIPLH